ncbi:MAG: TetR/AcrR family transcriptional regulator, partial [Gammaproteobacteria bacterium]|nr:TetR/AcrR family transcriptional regulator [Gammaproteobacteria bacterium]
MTQDLAPKDQLILNTAARHFAINGYGSARMDEIADDAGVNKATIYYRIGDKAALYENVYKYMLDTLLNSVQQNCSHIEDPAAALKTYIKTIALLCETNEFLPRIVLREVASQGMHLSEDSLKKMHQLKNFLTEILEDGVKKKAFGPTNPYLIHMLIIGFLNFYAAGKPIREKIQNMDQQQNYNGILPMEAAAMEIA